ncbi:EboA domain-containing protein [uncultured Rubinisphaera sp.]|uniref:EboA domain-containing protein n=1 Tax=uncultured Rubinisphaera sp. TaxID=1678686 RepID=UPI000EE0E124|nr:hypothetical protein [Planctomycetaceae bacterium]|tara:strand:- start:56 stop:934 length:879 start_codon:yes stop_codon:yes gene_type:complete
MSEAVKNCLKSWITARCDEATKNWIDASCELIGQNQLPQLYLRFGLVSRKVPKRNLELSADELSNAQNARTNWRPQNWSLIEAVRSLFVLSLPASNADEYVKVLDRLFGAGEVSELVALYQALPLYPFPEAHVNRAAEGIRTNMRSVFCAVAHDNPYPADQLPEGLWNQMVLKCLFVEVSLFPVIGLEARNNAALSQMLSDYAHERWAASRTVHPELWRCVDVDVYEPAIEDLSRVLKTGNDVESAAAGLALTGKKSPAAAELLSLQPELKEKIEQEQISWKTIHEQLFESP